jgi:hypothetical protein
MTTREPWTVIHGTRARISFPVLVDDKPYPIPGWAVDLKVKTKPGGNVLHESTPAHITLTATTHNGDTIPDSTLTLIIPAAISETWKWRKAWYRVVITAPGGDPADPHRYRILDGPLIIRPN